MPKTADNFFQYAYIEGYLEGFLTSFVESCLKTSLESKIKYVKELHANDYTSEQISNLIALSKEEIELIIKSEEALKSELTFESVSEATGVPIERLRSSCHYDKI